MPFDPPPFSLKMQPQRPGELAELIDVPIDADVARRVQERAAAAGLPLELVLYVTVEAERALTEAVEIVTVRRPELIEFLDDAAAEAGERGPRHVLVRPLEQYAVALGRGLCDVDVSAGPLRVRVPHRVAALWVHAAAAASTPFEGWLADVIARSCDDRSPWEAAAARTGRTLGEWVLLQATRCARSRSTSPQTTASG